MNGKTLSSALDALDVCNLAFSVKHGDDGTHSSRPTSTALNANDDIFDLFSWSLDPGIVNDAPQSIPNVVADPMTNSPPFFQNDPTGWLWNLNDIAGTASNMEHQVPDILLSDMSDPSLSIPALQPNLLGTSPLSFQSTVSSINDDLLHALASYSLPPAPLFTQSLTNDDGILSFDQQPALTASDVFHSNLAPPTTDYAPSPVWPSMFELNALLSPNQLMQSAFLNETDFGVNELVTSMSNDECSSTVTNGRKKRGGMSTQNRCSTRKGRKRSSMSLTEEPVSLNSPPPQVDMADLSSSSNKRRFPCSWRNCEASFSTSGHLARHLRVHLDLKPYVCYVDDCDARFCRLDHLKQHIKTHFKANGAIDIFQAFVSPRFVKSGGHHLTAPSNGHSL